MKFNSNAFILHLWQSAVALIPTWFFLTALRDGWTLWAKIPLGIICIGIAINHLRTSQGSIHTPFAKGGQIAIAYFTQMSLLAIIFYLDYGWARSLLAAVFAFFSVGCYNMLADELTPAPNPNNQQ